MNLILTAAAFLLGTPQGMPGELPVSQLESPRGTAIVVLGGQVPVITNRQLPATQIEQQQTPLRGRRFSVEFRGVELRAALTALGQEAGVNLVMPPDITGDLTIDLLNVNLAQALDAILTPRGLQFRIDDNLLRVDPVQMETRTFSFDYLAAPRARSPAAESIAGTIVGPAAGLSYGSGSEPADFMQEIENALGSLKSSAGRLNLNRMAGVVIATDYPYNLNMIDLFLETIQNAVNRQVVIETRIVEVILNQEAQTGVDWPAVLGNSERMEESPGVPFQVSATAADFTALLSALKNYGTVNVRSAPTIATMNNQRALIRTGTQDVFFTTTRVDGSEGRAAQATVTPAVINEGVVLDVTPQVSDDGIITMSIHPIITERTGQAVSPLGDVVPIINVRESNNVVRVADGSTVVIAGLMTDKEIQTNDKLRVLGIPLFGNLLKRTNKENLKSDLVVLLTPRIMNIRSAAAYSRERVAEQERIRTERNRQ